MRVIPVTVMGREFDLVFSNRVMLRMEEEKAEPDTARGNIVLLSAMMEAGDRYAKMNGKPGKGFLTVDEIADGMGPDELNALGEEIAKATQGDRNVEALPTEKNAQEAPPEA